MRELESPECTIFQVAFQNVITMACVRPSDRNHVRRLHPTLERKRQPSAGKFGSCSANRSRDPRGHCPRALPPSRSQPPPKGRLNPYAVIATKCFTVRAHRFRLGPEPVRSCYSEFVCPEQGRVSRPLPRLNSSSVRTLMDERCGKRC